jgi:phage-related protein
MLSRTGGSISGAVTAIKGWMIWSKIAGAATKVWTGIQAAFDVVMDANPIVLVVAGIVLLIGAIVLITMHSKAFRVFFIGMWHDITRVVSDAIGFIKSHWKLILGILTGPVGLAVLYIVDHWNKIRHETAHLIDDVINFIKSHWKLLPAIFLGPIGIVVSLILTHWNQISAMTSRMVGDVVRFLNGIPRFLAGLPGKMFAIGRNIIMGLVHGVESMFGAVGSAISHLAGLIPSGISSVLHMLSPSKVTFRHGQMVAAGLIGGMDSMHGPVAAAAARMAKAAGLPGAGGYGGAAAGAGSVLRVEVEWAGGHAAEGDFDRWLRNNIRIKGGSVQKAYGHGPG